MYGEPNLAVYNAVPSVGWLTDEKATFSALVGAASTVWLADLTAAGFNYADWNDRQVTPWNWVWTQEAISGLMFMTVSVFDSLIDSLNDSSGIFWAYSIVHIVVEAANIAVLAYAQVTSPITTTPAFTIGLSSHIYGIIFCSVSLFYQRRV